MGFEDDDDFDDYTGEDDAGWEDAYEGGNPDDWDGGDWQEVVRKQSRRRRDPEDEDDDEFHDAGLDSDFEDDDDLLNDENDLLSDGDLDDLDDDDRW